MNKAHSQCVSQTVPTHSCQFISSISILLQTHTHTLCPEEQLTIESNLLSETYSLVYLYERTETRQLTFIPLRSATRFLTSDL